MAKENYVAPDLGLEAFNCPNCGAFSHQSWNEVAQNGPNYFISTLYEGRIENYIKLRYKYNYGQGLNNICSISECSRCKGATIWEGPNMIHPNASIVEPPNIDMPEDIKALYKEADSIVNLSAKSAAALLRLALEKLLIHVGAKKGSIDIMIQDLIEKNIITASSSVRKALDTIRLIGNAGVHPTGINLDEDPTVAFALFKVLNFVVEKLISEEKEMDAIYAFVPEERREKLDKRRGE
ncbi:DUF4145 domain-containing protein [Peribacillus simplex]|uniref:DUF4145 domain-containing protein n=1 Tax=Peribacillus simplex TaxID=1478 RepID=A0AAW7IIA3_9BACI|nr:DUF4145 domain-containing protein [Peribacillus simplex]MDM5455225.1 DUF4145 domain-containing protein [Peribacillus simplex]